MKSQLSGGAAIENSFYILRQKLNQLRDEGSTVQALAASEVEEMKMVQKSFEETQSTQDVLRESFRGRCKSIRRDSRKERRFCGNTTAGPRNSGVGITQIIIAIQHLEGTGLRWWVRPQRLSPDEFRVGCSHHVFSIIAGGPLRS